MDRKDFVLLLLCFFISASVFGQKYLDGIEHSHHDSTYYDRLEELFLVRSFLTSKLSEFRINDNVLDKYLLYDSKAASAIGIGFSYKWIGLNLAFNVNNASHLSKEDSRWFNFQTQLYFKRFNIDLYSTLSKGYYLENAQHMIDGYGSENVYNRGDIKNATYGASGYYVFNWGRYSNRATFNQNEWQKKTAGSLLVGGNFLHNQISADSSLIPSQIQYPTFFDSVLYNRSKYWGITGNIGYALTYVIHENWFFDVNLLVGTTLGMSAVYVGDDDKMSAFKVGLNISNRFGIGYNSRFLYMALNYTSLQANLPLPVSSMSYRYKMGTVYFTVVYRFSIPEHESMVPDWVSKFLR